MTTIRYPYAFIQMSKVKRIEVQCVGKAVVQLDLSHVTGGNVKVRPFSKTTVQFLKILVKTKQPYHSAQQ